MMNCFYMLAYGSICWLFLNRTDVQIHVKKVTLYSVNFSNIMFDKYLGRSRVEEHFSQSKSKNNDIKPKKRKKRTLERHVKVWSGSEAERIVAPQINYPVSCCLRFLCAYCRNYLWTVLVTIIPFPKQQKNNIMPQTYKDLLAHLTKLFKFHSFSFP